MPNFSKSEAAFLAFSGVAISTGIGLFFFYPSERAILLLAAGGGALSGIGFFQLANFLCPLYPVERTLPSDCSTAHPPMRTVSAAFAKPIFTPNRAIQATSPRLNKFVK